MIFRGNPCWNSKSLRLSANPTPSPPFRPGSAITIRGSAWPWFIFSRSTFVRKHVVARVSGDDVDYRQAGAPILTARSLAADAQLRVGQLAKGASTPARVLPSALKRAHWHDFPLAGLRRR